MAGRQGTGEREPTQCIWRALPKAAGFSYTKDLECGLGMPDSECVHFLCSPPPGILVAFSVCFKCQPSQLTPEETRTGSPPMQRGGLPTFDSDSTAFGKWAKTLLNQANYLSLVPTFTVSWVSRCGLSIGQTHDDHNSQTPKRAVSMKACQ